MATTTQDRKKQQERRPRAAFPIERGGRITFDPRVEGFHLALCFRDELDAAARTRAAEALEEGWFGAALDLDRDDAPLRFSGRWAYVVVHAAENAPDIDLGGEDVILEQLGRALDHVHKTIPIDSAQYGFVDGGEVDEAAEEARRTARQRLGRGAVKAARAPLFHPVAVSEFPGSPRRPASLAHRGVLGMRELGDGRVLALVLDDSGTSSRLLVFGSDDSLRVTSEPLVRGAHGDSLAVHASGRRVLVPNPWSVDEVDLETGAVRPHFRPEGIGAGVYRVAWMDDARFVVTVWEPGIAVMKETGSGFEVVAVGGRAHAVEVEATSAGLVLARYPSGKVQGRLYALAGKKLREVGNVARMSAPIRRGDDLYARVDGACAVCVPPDKAQRR